MRIGKELWVFRWLLVLRPDNAESCAFRPIDPVHFAIIHG